MKYRVTVEVNSERDYGTVAQAVLAAICMHLPDIVSHEVRTVEPPPAATNLVVNIPRRRAARRKR